MDEINNAPNSFDGQGTNTPLTDNSGQGVAPNQEGGQGRANDTESFTRKIAEMGHQNAQLKQQLEQIQRQNQDYAQKVSKFEPVYNALGSAFQPKQTVNPVDSLLDDPNAFIAAQIKNNPDLLRSIVNETPEFQQLKQSETNRQVGEFIQSQNMILDNELNKLKSAGAFSGEQIQQLANLPTLMSRVASMTNSQGQPLTQNEQRVQVASMIQQVGGIEAVLQQEIGALVAKDPLAFARAGAVNLQQAAYRAKRGSAFTNNSVNDSAISASPSSSTTRVYR